MYVFAVFERISIGLNYIMYVIAHSLTIDADGRCDPRYFRIAKRLHYHYQQRRGTIFPLKRDSIIRKPRQKKHNGQLLLFRAHLLCIRPSRHRTALIDAML
jgi:hypothetical protein